MLMSNRAIESQFKSGLATIERAINNAEQIQPPKTERERLELKGLILDLDEMRQKFPTGGAYSNIRTSMRKVIELLNEKLDQETEA